MVVKKSGKVGTEGRRNVSEKEREGRRKGGREVTEEGRAQRMGSKGGRNGMRKGTEQRRRMLGGRDM